MHLHDTGDFCHKVAFDSVKNERQNHEIKRSVVHVNV